jgi:hypothetical protein
VSEPTTSLITGKEALIVFLAMLAAASALAYLHLLTGADWVKVMSWTVTVCVLGKAATTAADGYAAATVRKAEVSK